MGLSISGIGSNLDVDGIVSSLMQVERAPLDALTKREATVQSQISAYGTVKSALSTFQTAVSGLTTLSNLQTMQATSSDPSVGITAKTGAQPSAYSIEVSQLAQAQKLATAGQSDTQTAIGAGTITIDFGTISGGALTSDGKYSGATFTQGTADSKQIVISPGSSSLAGIRDAINAAQIGVTASIVNDGSSSPYRLVLTDQASGKAGSMRISVSGDAGLQNLLSHDPGSTTTAGQALSETRTAQDAKFKLDGVDITKSSNTVTDAIEGATLTLSKITTSPVDLTLSRDDNATITAINKFVTGYNQINKSLRDISAYNATTKVGAVLNGDATVRGLQSQLRSVLSTQVASGNSLYGSLSQIGVAMQADGTLAVDTTKLTTALSNDSQAVAKLFASSTSPSDSLISVEGTTSATGTGTFAINVTKTATQGQLVGGSAAGLTVTSGVNDQISLSINGTSSTITLSAGTYTADALAKEIQSQLSQNSTFNDAGAVVTVSQSNGVLSLTSKAYGSTSNVQITGGNDPSYFFGTPASTSGQDVEGTINNVAAKGVGQSLIGAVGDQSEGLRVVVNGATGDRGTVTYTKGYASLFNDMLNQMLDTTGAVSTRTAGLNVTLTSMQKQADDMNTRLTALQAQYRSQYSALDSLLSSMNSTSTYLTQQLARLG